LRALVSTSQKDDQFSSELLEIHAVTRAILNPQLRDAFTDWFDIPWVSRCQAFDPDLDSRPGLKVTQVVKPVRILLALLFYEAILFKPIEVPANGCGRAAAKPKADAESSRADVGCDRFQDKIPIRSR
jgi:hypothetical protein